MRNIEMAWVFHEIADLLEFKGEDFFKINAYRRAARTIAGLEYSVAELYKNKELEKIPGLGKGIISKIGELLSSGTCQLHAELKAETSPKLMELMTLPGLGPKRTRLIYEELGVTSLDELEKAARAREVRKLPGMGSKTEQSILRGISRLKKKAYQVPLGVARELATELSEYLGQLAAVQKVNVTGDVRRWSEMVNCVSLLAVAQDVKDVLDAFIIHPALGEVIWREKDRVQVNSRWGVAVELIVVSQESYWFALLWSTGSQPHFRRLQLLAWRQGWRLERDRMVFRSSGAPARVNSEDDIYRLLKLPYIVPELRENNGEITAASTGSLPGLLELSDIRGDLHLHTNWSDGVSSIEDMAQRAREKGYSYIAITDHSVSLKIAKGLSQERLLAQFEKIQVLNEQLDDFYILTGVEVDILSDGSLDYVDEVLAQADVVVASVHSGFKQDRDKITRRVLAAIENEHVDIIGHPTGRLLGHREPYAIDVGEVIEAAARHQKILEINSSPDRLDLNEFYVQLARESGVKISINTDAHDRRCLEDMRLGVSVARRAWLEPQHIINTLPLAELLDVLHRKK